MSASGPAGPIFFGVWQSWQPPPMTSILPRSTCDTAGAAAGTSLRLEGAWAGGAACSRRAPRTTGISTSDSDARQTQAHEPSLLV